MLIMPISTPINRGIKKYDGELSGSFEMFILDWYNEDAADESDEQSEKDSQSGSGGSNGRQEQFNGKFLLKAFGMDREGRSICLDITDFQPYFYVKVPDKWTDGIVDIFINGLKQKIRKFHRETLVSWKMVHAKPFYYFTGDDRYKFKFVKLVFNSHAGYRSYEYTLRDKLKIPGIGGSGPAATGQLYERFESNILPVLRFIHSHDLNATGWIQIPSGKYHKTFNETTSQLQLTCHWSDVKKFECDDVPPIHYLSYDIEGDSSHGDFPIASKDYQKLARDVITEYNRLQDEARGKLDDVRGILLRLLELAFNPNYSNNNIRSVRTLGNEKPTEETMAMLIPEIQAIFNDSPDEQQDKMLELFEMNLPPLDPDSEIDYYSLSDLFLKDHARLKKNNNVRYQTHPADVVKLMLELAFDDHVCSVNVVYPQPDSTLPTRRKLECLVPRVCSICEQCRKHVVQERKCGRRKLKPGETKITIDDFVEQLNTLFNGHFPALQGDPVIQIGSVFKRYGEKDPYLKHIITLDTCSPISNETMIAHEHKDINIPVKELASELTAAGHAVTEDDLKDLDRREHWNKIAIENRHRLQMETDTAKVIVESYRTEQELLLAWVTLIRETDPDLIIGYNIFGFDYKYLYGRAKVLGIAEEFWRLGRIDWKETGKKDECVLVEQKLSSSGLGDNTLFYLQMFGRISIDLYKVTQASQNLISYKLDYVCKHFLGKSKNDLPPSEIFIHQKGTVDDRRTIAEYCLIDCLLVTRYFDKMDIINNTIGMSVVCSVPFSFLFLRGQGIKLLSFVSKVCRLKGYLIPVLKRDDDGDNNEKYEGAIVLNSQNGIYFEPVAVADFNSLYPSCMISENLSHESYVGFKIVSKDASLDYRGVALDPTNQFEQMLLNGDFQGWEYVDIAYEIYEYVPTAPGRKKTKKIVKGYKICRFAQPPNGAKSIVPSTLQGLLDSRASTRKTQQAYPKGSFKYNILEGRQLAYKVTANSLYGQTGAKTSSIFMIDIAACTTATGRSLIKFSKNYCEKNYAATVIYGDTDSIFVKFKTCDRYGNKLVGLDAIYKSMELCLEAASGITKQLKRPHNLAFEKAIWPFVLVSKKRYHGHYYTGYGNPSYEPKSMGIVLKRRDNADIVKHIFGGMIDIIMKKHSVPEALEFVKVECDKLLKGKFGLEYFTLTKTLRSYYKAPDQIAHNVLAQRIGKRDPGNKPQGNDRVPFAHIRVKDQKCLQGDKIETPEFIKAHDLKIDYRYYLTNQIMTPVTQILELAIPNAESLFDEILIDYDNGLIGAQKIMSGKFSSIVRPIKLNATSARSLRKPLAEVAPVEEDTESGSDSGSDSVDSDSESDVGSIDDI